MMESLPEFRLIAPGSVAEAVAAKAADPTARFVAGGTDLLPNLRRGIGAPATLIDLAALPGFAEIAEAGETLSIGAGVGIARLAKDARLATRFSAIVQAAGEIAGPTHRAMATVGGNLCLDTRCIYYNQSQWWRQANEFCLKHQGEVCHVAPTGKRCHAAFSGDLAPALLVHEAKAEIAGPKGTRRIPLADLYHEEGRSHLTLDADELLIRVLVPAPASGLASGYLKGRLRQSIDFPLAGAAVAV
ncbi:MAG: 4-hydroxybenzoyl-CoA reductase subunit beta, partial [Alphaproteobacteria bacterium]|nr:4-hydroxybenzoyl-CoA reductase subunit beta [Alphaproteobacteria bacterium]